MNAIWRIFSRRLSTAKFDSAAGAIVCYCLAVAVLVAGVRGLALLTLSETELLLVTLGIVILSLLMAAFGAMMELTSKIDALSEKISDAG